MERRRVGDEEEQVNASPGEIPLQDTLTPGTSASCISTEGQRPGTLVILVIKKQPPEGPQYLHSDTGRLWRSDEDIKGQPESPPL